MFEVHRDTGPDDGLHLPQTPVRRPGVADERAGLQKRIDVSRAAHPGAGARKDPSLVTAIPPPDPLQLAALVSSRLCHDLISPIGAIGNGLELLQSTLPGAPELALIADSAATAAAKIRFFRIAFGAAGPSDTLDARTVGEAVRGMYATGRLSVEFPAGGLPRSVARLAFLLVLCGESALPLGGVLNVAVEEGPRLRLIAEGRRTRFDPAPWAHLRTGDPFPDCSSAQVHFLLARRILSESRLRAVLSEAEGGFVLVAEPG